MKTTYIYHSCFLVETKSFYYLFDYEKGNLPEMDVCKPIYVLSSHGHHDHYNPNVFSMLKKYGMQQIYAVLSDDIKLPADVKTLQVSPGKEYLFEGQQKLTTFCSTDLGVAFLIEEGEHLIYHAGDLNDWVWEGESDSYNEQMTVNYRKEMQLLAETLGNREIDLAFVVLDPRQEKDYDRGLSYFLKHIPVKEVYPMHYWEKPEIIDAFLNAYPEYQQKIHKTE